MWYVHRDGETTGPFDAEHLAQRLADGTLSPTDYWWDEETQVWASLAEHPALSAMFATALAESSMEQNTAAAPGALPKTAPKTMAQPSSGPLSAASFQECWRSLQDLIPKAPPVDHPFACDGCGIVKSLAALHYQRQSYLCADCARAGVVKKNADIVTNRNPFSHLLMQHAGVWALILILVPFLGFKMLADMLDPYKSFPPYYADLKQSIRILDEVQEIKSYSWAHAIRQTLLHTGDAASRRALPQTNDADRDIAYLARLLTLEALGRDTDAVTLIRSESKVQPPVRDEDQQRAFRWVEVRILERFGAWDLIEPRLQELTPTRMMPGTFNRVAPAINSPILSGSKAYDIELRTSLYKLIEIDNEKIAELTGGAVRYLGMAPVGMGSEENLTSATDQGAWSTQEFERLRQEANTLAIEGDALISQNVSALQKNADLDEAKLSAAFDAAIKAMGSRVQIQSQRVNREGSGGHGACRADVNLQIGRLADVIALVEKLTGSEFPKYSVLTQMNANHTSYGRQDRWQVRLSFHLPAPSGFTGTMRSQVEAEFAARLDSDAAHTEARVQTGRMLVNSLRAEVAELKQNSRQQVEATFGPVAPLLKTLAAAAPGGLMEISLDASSMIVAGEGSTSASMESVKARMAARVAERRLTEDAQMQNDTYQGKTIVRWRISYRAPSR